MDHATYLKVKTYLTVNKITYGYASQLNLDQFSKQPGRLHEGYFCLKSGALEPIFNQYLAKSLIFCIVFGA